MVKIVKLFCETKLGFYELCYLKENTVRVVFGMLL